MTDVSDAARLFAEFVVELDRQPDVNHTVQAAAEFAVTAIGCQSAGILLQVEPKRVETVAATDPAVWKADELQVQLGEGPCLAALRVGDTFSVEDTTTDEQWPRWSREAAALGLRSALGVALDAGNRRIGALNLYHGTPGAFTDGDAEIAKLLAQHAAIAVANARQRHHLTQAVDGRTVIGQAQGLLMERYDLTADQAFAVLRRYSQQTNTKLRDVAQELIDNRRLPGVGNAP